MAEEPLYGAFGDILTLDDTEKTEPKIDDFTYGVYQLATQKPDVSQQDLQATYGTSAMPIFEWVKTIQTGERKYDPNNPDDKAKLDEFKKLGTPPGFLTPEEIEKQMIADTAIGITSTIGAGVGTAISQDVPYLEGIKSTFGLTTLPKDVLKKTQASNLSKTIRDALDVSLTKEQGGGNLIYNEALASREAAKASGNLPLYDKLQKQRVPIGDKDQKVFAYRGDGDTIRGVKKEEIANMKGGFQNYTASTLPEKSTYWQRVKADATSPNTYSSSAGAGVATFFTDLLLTKGKDPAKSAKKGGGAAVGTYIGSTLGGPIGAVVGSTIGASLGGRVICNELRRHGMMTTEDILIDYYFTQKYLTPTHVNGYHIWAISVVRKMRQGKSVKLWYHIANHRLNEVKYILGKRDKPDYLGKLYRFIGETTCYILGKFCKKTDWSVLYNKKEI